MHSTKVEHQTFVEQRLGALRNGLANNLRDLGIDEQVCIYATGSYGRSEAWEGSDIDLFLLEDSGTGDSLSHVSRSRLLGRIIDTTYRLEFPAFDADGRFLDIHDLEMMKRELGSPQDDGVNAFTARMLLILESKPVFADALYNDYVGRVVDLYLEDFGDHSQDFLPLYLLNDILRFWRTLTLNYEHDRRRRLTEADTPEVKKTRDEALAESALKNYKLKFSRLLTCFSMVVWLATDEISERQDIVDLIRLTPLERLGQISEKYPGQVGVVQQLEERYDAFLRLTHREKASLFGEFKNPSQKQRLTKEATLFGEDFHHLIDAVASEGRRRYLIV